MIFVFVVVITVQILFNWFKVWDRIVCIHIDVVISVGSSLMKGERLQKPVDMILVLQDI